LSVRSLALSIFLFLSVLSHHNGLLFVLSLLSVFLHLAPTVGGSSRQGEFIGHPHACPPPTHEGCAVHPKPLTTCPAPKVGRTVSRLGGIGCDSLFPSVTSYASLRFPSYGSSSMSYNPMLIPLRVGKLHLILANPSLHSHYRACPAIAGNFITTTS